MNNITSLQHPLVKHLSKLRTDASYRYEHKTLLIDGIKPIRELLRHIRKILHTVDSASIASALPGEKWEVTEAILHKVSGMVSPEGIIAEVAMPPFISLSNERRVIAFDAISDPGNLGTLLRTALAFGWEAVYFLPGCCDPFNEKALRAARGAHFKISLAKGTAEELEQWVKQNNISSYMADLNGERPEHLSKADPTLLVLGNEAHGPSEEVRRFCKPVTLPMPGEMESLNVGVAGGILLYLLA